MTDHNSRTSTPPAAASDGVTGVYGITVAAELTGMSVQALRLYERKGLVEPTRTSGGTRRYSDTDITRLRRVGILIDEGINLTGIARVLGLEADNAGLRTQNADLTTSNTALKASNTELKANYAPHRDARNRRITGRADDGNYPSFLADSAESLRP